MVLLETLEEKWMIENIRLLHLNDLHSHLEAFPKVSRFFREASQTDAQVIKLDLGDNIDRSHPLSDATKGKANVELMNQLGIDFATIGNNEGIGLSKEELNKVYDEANFTLIIGNLKDEGKQPVWGRPYSIYETAAGTKIAFLAYTFPYDKTYAPNGWQIEEPIAALKRDLQIPQVAHADIRILLSHLGIRVDEKITEEVDQLDLIIGSHTHHVFEEGACLNGTYMACAGKYGEHVGEINMQVTNHRLSHLDIIAHETSHMATEKGDKEQVNGFLEQGKTLLSKIPVASLAEALNEEASLELIMDAMIDYADADLAIINSGLLLAPFRQELSRKDLHLSLPHQMRLATFTLSEQQLSLLCYDMFEKAELLKNQEIRGMGFRGKHFGKLMTRGFEYKNGKIVYNRRVIGKSDAMKVVVVDQYYFASYFSRLKEMQVELLFPELLREVLELYLKKRN
ncbi:bifunctional metallophosphatase/5'-nucleotidase [Streptococcus iniae]|uniref:Bifunctional metallophosphatase/5'-nucleotidase n=3 Tax=Streptococcus iniae TaxID=1346 RepID=A0A3L8GNE4_STRIN|nr:phosphoesterase [Streptococcus iniae SF1]AYB02355.1 bifunctional metallophosphatase/5'-nucleotidase [Streptococcus iniae]EKB51450.1 Ser/Thr protein phosphatase [Streptococcus iniae 9117]AYB04222.1 bifunctional metallophosphatase/5'-nucleotidase [Streptococcus iniae]RLU29049.1 bifunctional metallophosphatase/5'-nucleotidase [Streptococcus iniae]